MPDYKLMYYHLYRQTAVAVELLASALRTAEDFRELEVKKPPLSFESGGCAIPNVKRFRFRRRAAISPDIPPKA